MVEKSNPRKLKEQGHAGQNTTHTKKILICTNIHMITFTNIPT